HRSREITAESSLQAERRVCARVGRKQHEGPGARPRIPSLFCWRRSEIISTRPGDATADFKVAAVRNVLADVDLRLGGGGRARPNHDQQERDDTPASRVRLRGADHFATTLSSTPEVPPPLGTTTIFS